MSRLKALIGKRVESGARPRIRYAFVLDPDLHAEWVEARDELDDMPAPVVDSESGSARPERLGGPRQQLTKRVADLEASVAAATGVALFEARSADEMEDLMAAWGADGLKVPARSRAMVEACFVRWEEDGQPVDDVGLDELAALLPFLSEGELYGISTPLVNLSRSQVDLPKSVRQYIETRNSETSSKPAANGA